MGERTMLACTNCKQRKLKVPFSLERPWGSGDHALNSRNVLYSATGKAQDAVIAPKPTEVFTGFLFLLQHLAHAHLMYRLLGRRPGHGVAPPA